MRIKRLWKSACAVLLFGSALQVSAKPNIVFILADDLGYGEVGFMGQEKIQTPALDKIAKESMVFEQMYAGGPVCGPSRACLLTGMSQDIGYIKGNPGGDGNRENLRDKDLLFTELLQDAGYYNVYLGKWGLGPQGKSGYPLNKGFDYFVGYDTHKSAHNYYPKSLCKNEGKLELEKGTYTHDVFTEEALTFLDEGPKQPFLLFIGYTIPHSPFNPPNLEPYVESEKWDKTAKKYASMITRMDRDIGKIHDKLREKGLLENTLFVFTSDNGTSPYGKSAPKLFNSSGPLRGIKRDVFDGGIKVPTLVSMPGTVEAGRTAHVAAFQDFMPTLCELAGIKPSPTTNGISFVPTLKGEPQKPHDYLYWEHIQMQKSGMGRQAVLDVKNSLKAVRFGRNGKIRLYDLSKDEAEQKDIASQYPEKAELMKKKIDGMRGESKGWPIEMHDTPYNPPKN
jgi:arylsulfatase A-like enzyme